MPDYLARKELLSLDQWYTRHNRKPLVVRGARQVGKSTLVRQFANSVGRTLVEIDLERNPEFSEIFRTKDPEEITTALALLTGKKITPHESLLFIDEVQNAPEAFSALRYFYEEMPRLPVIAAGSLLDFALANVQYSMPVGRIEYFYLGPMQFDDFLKAMGEQELVRYLDQLSLDYISRQSIVEPVHQRCLTLLAQYWVIGGLPESVATYAATRDYLEVARIQQGIIATYRDDFSKYSHGKQTDLVRLVFDRIPLMVGKKFKYSNVTRDFRAAEINSALQKLCLARITAKIHHTSANGIPLGAEIKANQFKILYLDIGLMSAALSLNVLDLSKDDLTFINSGALAEQFVGQQLVYSTPEFSDTTLYYWTREAKSASAEVDYLLTKGQEIVPVEIKAGSSGALKSLHQFLKEKHRSFAIRFNADRPSLLNDTKLLTDGREINYLLLSLPLYMVGQSDKLLQQLLDQKSK